MKTIFCLIAMVIGWTRIEASVFQLSGDLNYEITEPRCTFNLNGSIQNNTPGTSGTVKLVLWATPNPFPSPGYIVAEYTLGEINGGSQFSDFSLRTTSNVPAVTGNYYFTIAVAEYTSSGWRNVLAAQTGTRSLQNGNFSDQEKWTIPPGPYLKPDAALKLGEVLKLTVKATDQLNLLPIDSQDKSILTVGTRPAITVKDPLGTRNATRIYKVKTEVLNNKNVQAAVLDIDYANSNSHATITLYFRAKHSGCYKCEATETTGTETTWGNFTSQ